MIGLLGLYIAFQASRPLFPKDASYSDRAGFYAALSRVRANMPAGDARKILGTPDDVIHDHDELGGYVADEIWNYGTDRHLGVVTLGSVYVQRGHVFWISPRQPDVGFKQVVPEGQFRRLIRLIGGESRGRYDEAAWRLRSANALIDAGHDGAVSALQICESLESPTLEGNIGDLMTLIFEVPDPPGYPVGPEPDIFKPALKPTFRKESRFPMIVYEDIPFVFSLGSSFSTGPGRTYLPQFKPFPIRTKRLRPPDDPFLACERLVASDLWPFPDHARADERFRRPYKEQLGFAMQQVLQLVFDVYQPVDYRSEFPGNGLDLAKFHRGFLKVHAHWDDKLQRYVRQDGVTLVQKKDPAVQKWLPPDFNNLQARVTLQRRGVSDYVNASVEVSSKGSGPWLPEILLVTDAKTGRRFGSVQFVPLDGHSATELKDLDYLAMPIQSGQSWGGGSGCGLTIPAGASARVGLKTREGTVQGPVLKP